MSDKNRRPTGIFYPNNVFAKSLATLGSGYFWPFVLLKSQDHHKAHIYSLMESQKSKNIACDVTVGTKNTIICADRVSVELYYDVN